MNRTLIYFCFSLLLSACSDRQIGQYESPAAIQYAYFPLQIGKYLIYQVDSVSYDFAENGGLKRDSSTTFVRELITDTLRDNSGLLQYTVERSERISPDQAWILTQINTRGRNDKQAYRTENNLRFLSLIFPMDKRSAWDGNLWIDENKEIQIFGERMRPFVNWAYEVDSIDIPASIGSFLFDSTLLVTEANDQNVIERRFSEPARYAKHIGVVWREQLILDSQYCNQSPPPTDCESKPWEEKAEKGYIIRQKLLEFN